jgi:hypothetical protein
MVGYLSLGVLKGSLLRSWFADLLPRSRGFAPGSVHLGLVVDKVSLGQVSLKVLRFYPVGIIPPSSSILTYHLGDSKLSVSGSSSET